MRVAIAGLGPKGLYALERLLAHAAGLGGGASIEIDAFEPHPVPGAGPVYDPGQPDFLRMNFQAGQVDMWWPDGGVVPADERRSFVEWQGDVEEHAYPPRAAVGRYLADGLSKLRRHAPPSTTVRVIESRVSGLRRRGREWEVSAPGAARRYDEVLLATGHETVPNGALARSWRHAAPLVPAVFPVEECLSRDRVPPGATVAVRGYALTFIDAAIALTEGRGGRFERPAGASGLLYAPGDGDVGVLLPYSRTGRPMLAKPAAAGDAVDPAARARIAALPAGFDPVADLLPIVASVAEVPGRRAAAVLAGEGTPDEELAFGAAWRDVYPAVVACLGADRMARSAWPSFRRLASDLERIAFGPSPENAAKLVALIEAGRVDLSHVAGGWLETRGSSTTLGSENNGRTPVDRVLDAVLPPPGVAAAPSPLIAGLLRAGEVRIPRGRRGLDVGPDCSCIGRGGRAAPGLSAIGRPTEDSVVGNDTLSRTLHPGSDLWARRVAARVATGEVGVAA